MTEDRRPSPAEGRDSDAADVLAHVERQPRRWLVTGVAGFIGSNLLETLLASGQEVVGLDDLSSGYLDNLKDVEARVGPERWKRFTLVRGDIRSAEDCARATESVDVVLHHAAVASVPASIERPADVTRINVEGFVNVLQAAQEAGTTRVVYATSSAVYGDDPAPQKHEDTLGTSLSPYAASKRANELYADTYAAVHGMNLVGLRYFNVYGRRQDPSGYYAAVIPSWIERALRVERCVIYGDGSTTRDFCHVSDVVRGNLLAATVDVAPGTSGVFNIGSGHRTDLRELHAAVQRAVVAVHPSATAETEPRYEDFRPGDVKHSGADVARARDALGFESRVELDEGLEDTVAWYAGRSAEPSGR